MDIEPRTTRVLATIGLPSDDAGLRRRVETFILCNDYDRVFLATRYTAAQAAMESVTLDRVEEQLRRLSPDKLALVSDFISTLANTDDGDDLHDLPLAAETSLQKDWDSPEEDAAWAHL